MYLQHFGLTELPFGITPDPDFVFSATAHQEALNTLMVAVRSGESIVKITGEVGTGKTMLCRRFLAGIGEGFVTAYIPNPNLEPRTLLLALAEELGVAIDPATDQYHLVKGLNEALLEHARNDRAVVLCLDEAQAMPLESLEAVRLLSNLETEKRKLLQLVLFGQPELDVKLADPSVRQIRQRISFQYQLGNLSSGEMDHYLAHRLRVAGFRGPRLFSLPATRQLHYSSRGTPRLANILAHKAMLAAFGEGGTAVAWRHVRAAVRDSAGTRQLPMFW